MSQLEELKQPPAYRSYRVLLNTSQLVAFVVEARTPEEAEDIATEWFEDGEQPQAIESSQTTVEEVMPVEEFSSDEVYNDGTGFRS